MSAVAEKVEKESTTLIARGEVPAITINY